MTDQQIPVGALVTQAGLGYKGIVAQRNPNGVSCIVEWYKWDAKIEDPFRDPVFDMSSLIVLELPPDQSLWCQGARVEARKRINPKNAKVSYDVCVAGMKGTILQCPYEGAPNQALVEWDEPREANDFPMTIGVEIKLISSPLTAIHDQYTHANRLIEEYQTHLESCLKAAGLELDPDATSDEDWARLGERLELMKSLIADAADEVVQDYVQAVEWDHMNDMASWANDANENYGNRQKRALERASQIGLSVADIEAAARENLKNVSNH